MKEYTYNELSVGSRYRTKFVLTETMAKSYVECLGIPYEQGQPLPTAILSSFKPWYEALGGRFPQGTVHLKQSTEHFGHPLPGDEYDVEVVIADKFVKKERNYVVYETTMTKDDKLICKQKTTQLLAFT